eukprot:jgi/Undpi1/7354/HiC_scaffold_22.g09827.m1
MRGVPGTQYKVHRADVVGLNSGGVASGKGFPMPYGELGNVEQSNVCCFIGFTSNLSGLSAEGRTPIVPGNCCERALVQEVVRELKLRMKARGDTGQIKRAEENLSQVLHLHAKIDAVMAHLQIPPVEAPMQMTDRSKGDDG